MNKYFLTIVSVMTTLLLIALIVDVSLKKYFIIGIMSLIVILPLKYLIEERGILGLDNN